MVNRRHQPVQSQGATIGGRRTLSDYLPPWLKTLRVRLALPFILLSTSILLVLVLLAGWQLEDRYTEQMRTTLRNHANVGALTVAQFDSANGTDPTALVERIASGSGTRVTLIASDGTVLADSDAATNSMDLHNQRPEVIEARESGFGDDRRQSRTTGEWYLYSAVVVPDADGKVLRVAESLDAVETSVERIQLTILLAAVVMIVALSAAALWMSGRIAGPLDQLRTQANRVARGDFSSSISPTTVTEIDEVVSAFTVMTQALERSLGAQEQTRTRLNAIMEGLADGVVLTDASGIVVRMNRAAEEMLDIEEAAALGSPFVQVVRDHELERVMRGVLSGRGQDRATVVYGIEQRSLAMTARMLDGARERLGLAVMRDVTELRRLESVRREFVANVSHELRTPLTSIRVLVETLEVGAIDDPEMAQDFLGRIVGEVDRLNALVEDLLDFARLEAGRTPLQLEKVPVGETIRAGAERLLPQIERARLSLELDIEEGLPEIQLDTKRIEQVLLNLIHNAIKFTPPGGTVTISVAKRGREVEVTVKDTGVGIPPEELPRLFERFYKSDKARRSEGTGLGLAIAKHIVTLHGGELRAESVQGEGATFIFTLPIKGKRARKRARRQSAGLL